MQRQTSRNSQSYNLFIHTQSTFQQFPGADLVINRDIFSNDFSVGDYVSLSEPANPKKDLIFRINESTFQSIGTVQISIIKNVAEQFSLKSFSQITIKKVDPSSANVDFVEFAFSRQFLQRGNMWRFKEEMLGRPVHIGQNVTLAGGIKAQIQEIIINKLPAKSGIISKTTHLNFRCRSTRIIWLVQISSEMWEYDQCGDLYFEKFLNKFVDPLLDKWKALATSHSLSIIFFTRTLYHYNIETLTLPEFAKKASFKEHVGTSPHSNPKYQDFYKVVVENSAEIDKVLLLQTLKKEFWAFPENVGWNISDSDDRTNFYPTKVPSDATNGNFLEAINITLNLLDKHYMDRDLTRTGNSIVMISAGTGIIKVKPSLGRLTKQRMTDTGIGIDFVSLSQPPLHYVPIFHVDVGSEGEGLGKLEPDFYEVPHWINVSYVDCPVESCSTTNGTFGMFDDSSSGHAVRSSYRWTGLGPRDFKKQHSDQDRHGSKEELASQWHKSFRPLPFSNIITNKLLSNYSLEKQVLSPSLLPEHQIGFEFRASPNKYSIPEPLKFILLKDSYKTIELQPQQELDQSLPSSQSLTHLQQLDTGTIQDSRLMNTEISLAPKQVNVHDEFISSINPCSPFPSVHSTSRRSYEFPYWGNIPFADILAARRTRSMSEDFHQDDAFYNGNSQIWRVDIEMSSSLATDAAHFKQNIASLGAEKDKERHKHNLDSSNHSSDMAKYQKLQKERHSHRSLRHSASSKLFSNSLGAQENILPLEGTGASCPWSSSGYREVGLDQRSDAQDYDMYADISNSVGSKDTSNLHASLDGQRNLFDFVMNRSSNVRYPVGDQRCSVRNEINIIIDKVMQQSRKSIDEEKSIIKLMETYDSGIFCSSATSTQSQSSNLKLPLKSRASRSFSKNNEALSSNSSLLRQDHISQQGLQPGKGSNGSTLALCSYQTLSQSNESPIQLTNHDNDHSLDQSMQSTSNSSTENSSSLEGYLKSSSSPHNLKSNSPTFMASPSQPNQHTIHSDLNLVCSPSQGSQHTNPGGVNLAGSAEGNQHAIRRSMNHARSPPGSMNLARSPHSFTTSGINHARAGPQNTSLKAKKSSTPGGGDTTAHTHNAFTTDDNVAKLLLIREIKLRVMVNPFNQVECETYLTQRTHNRMRWKDVFALGEKPFNDFGLHWKSLSQPAILPLTTEYVPTVEQLCSQFKDFSNYQVFCLPSCPFIDPEDLLREMICQRLSHEYQLVDLEHDLNKPHVPAYRYFAKTRATKMPKDYNYNLENDPFYILTMGHRIQLLSYDVKEKVINVLILISKNAVRNSCTAEYHYTYELWVPLTESYQTWNQTFYEFPDTSSLNTEISWNQADKNLENLNLIIENFDSATSKAKRLRFVIIPDVIIETAQACADDDSNLPEIEEYFLKFDKLIQFLKTKRSLENINVQIDKRPHAADSRNATDDKDLKMEIIWFDGPGTDNPKWAFLRYDGSTNINRAFHLEIHWNSCDSWLMEEFVAVLFRRCASFGLKLVQVPEFFCSKNLDVHPYRGQPYIAVSIECFKDIRVHPIQLIEECFFQRSRGVWIVDDNRDTDWTSLSYESGTDTEQGPAFDDTKEQSKRWSALSTLINSTNHKWTTESIRPQRPKSHQYMLRSGYACVRVGSKGFVWLLNSSAKVSDVTITIETKREIVQRTLRELTEYCSMVSAMYQIIAEVVDSACKLAKQPTESVNVTNQLNSFI